MAAETNETSSCNRHHMERGGGYITTQRVVSGTRDGRTVNEINESSGVMSREDNGDECSAFCSGARFVHAVNRNGRIENAAILVVSHKNCLNGSSRARYGI